MQGPFSEELNAAMINSIGAKFVVTKESAASGGFEEKVNACLKTGTECLVLKKPEEEGITLKEFKEIIRGNV
jgi:precorrin-6x reductase